MLQVTQKVTGQFLEFLSFQDAFSLLAYPDPWNSSVGGQLDPSGREPVCAQLNSAILGMASCNLLSVRSCLLLQSPNTCRAVPRWRCLWLTPPNCSS